MGSHGKSVGLQFSSNATLLIMFKVVVLFVLISVAIVAAFQIPSFTYQDNFAALVLLLFFYCTASINLNYCTEKLFIEPSMGQLAIISGNVLIGVFTMLIVLMFETFPNNKVQCKSNNFKASNFLEPIYLFLVSSRI